MKTIRVSKEHLVYDDSTDVLYIGLADPAISDEEEVLPGVHVLYRYGHGRLDDIIAVEIEYFKERYKDLPAKIEIPLKKPLVLEVPSFL